MNRFKSTLMAGALVALAALTAAPALAQQKRLSPHETISTIVEGTYANGTRVIVVYGRPYSKDPRSSEIRKIWGTLVPYGKVWRTGADEATMLVTPQPLDFGGTVIPAGAYTLFTLPLEDGTAKLIISKQIGQWGLQYDEKQDLARIDLKKEATPTMVDQFTMAIDKTPTGGLLKMMWENTQYSVAFAVKK